VFANCRKEEEIFPLTTPEIVEAQKADGKLKHCFKRNAVLDKGLDARLVDDTYVVCKDCRMLIPKPLQRCAVLWYHHWSSVISIFVFVIHKQKFVICDL
jgi:hypothetical protein